LGLGFVAQNASPKGQEQERWRMCQLFLNADPTLWETRLRSVRMHGFSTSVRLEKIYWMLLEEIARRDGLSVAEILARLYEELLGAHGTVENFASFLRVCCARYLMLQLAGDIPADLSQPIAGLDAGSILAREKRRLAGAASEPALAPQTRPREARPGGLI
jgi:predicted DNA-binding ribbon-helix-helix protein